MQYWLKHRARHFWLFFPRYFIQALALFLDIHYGKGIPEFIFFKENFFLFNIFFEQFNDDEFLQISTLILVAKDRALKISKDECLERWTLHNCFSQTLSIAQFSIKLLDNIAMNNKIVAKFLDFVLQYKNNVKHFDRWIQRVLLFQSIF